VQPPPSVLHESLDPATRCTTSARCSIHAAGHKVGHSDDVNERDTEPCPSLEGHERRVTSGMVSGKVW
jgi:hypothetical protein